MVFEAAYSAEIDEFDAFDAVSESHGSENMELQQDEVAVADNVQSKASKWREIWQKRKEKELRKIKGRSNGKKKLKRKLHGVRAKKQAAAKKIAKVTAEKLAKSKKKMHEKNTKKGNGKK